MALELSGRDAVVSLSDEQLPLGGNEESNSDFDPDFFGQLESMMHTDAMQGAQHSLASMASSASSLAGDDADVFSSLEGRGMEVIDFPVDFHDLLHQESYDLLDGSDGETCARSEQGSECVSSTTRSARRGRTREEKLLADRLRKARAYAQLQQRRQLEMTEDQRAHFREIGRVAAKKSRMVRKVRWERLAKHSSELFERNYALGGEVNRLAMDMRRLREQVLLRYTSY